MLFFFFFFGYLTRFSLFCIDRALLRPTDMSLLTWRGATDAVAGLSNTVGDYDTDLDEVEESLT